MPDGHGHRYDALIVAGWAAIAAPEGPTATAALVAAARAAGLSWRELGLHRSTWWAGARWGAPAVVGVLAAAAASGRG